MSEVESPIPAEDRAVADSSQPPPAAATTDPQAGATPSDAPPDESHPGTAAVAPPAAESAAGALSEGAAVEGPESPASDEPVAGDAEAVVESTLADERPLVGPKIIGMAPPDRPPAPVKRLPRPRRRRLTAADKHRRQFFQKLNEMRREGRPGTGEAAASDLDPTATPTATEGEAELELTTPPPAVDDVAAVEAPVAEEPAVEQPAVEQPTVEEPTVEEPAPEEPASTAVDPPSAEPTGTEPAADEPTADEATAEPPIAADGSPSPETTAVAERGPARQPRREAPPLDAKARARLAVAVERVGGAEVIQAALVPKQDEEGAPKRWALVCCELAQGIPPGDPVYVAWLRLASTPVREVKGALRALAPEREVRGRGGGPRGERSAGGGGPRGGGGGERSGGGGARGERSGGGASRDRGDQPRGGPRDRPPRPDRGERVPAGAGLDGSFTPKVRIVTSDNDERAERDRLRKEEREAKRRAAQERLDRLGF